MRLVGGDNERQGRIEICFNETWGTVCDNFWSTNDAIVACRQLGFSKIGNLLFNYLSFTVLFHTFHAMHIHIIGAVVFSDAFFGAGSGQIYRNNLQCTGSELRLADCPHGSTATCTHQDDAGLMCNTSKN